MLMNKIFKKQIGKTMEVYVDDMLVKVSILHFKSSPRCRDSLSKNGEAHFLACGFREKTKALLSSTPDNCHDRISFEIDPPQAQRFSATREMGYRTQSLVQKAINIGYFWPTMRHNSTEYVKRCDRC
ncbi:hypothetical protein L3X38_010346 [Prunus dulcis]|uniref:Integrase zinc-binding domain-containing protein n=1 Tax=Prunus dulcis TaxID=3755 RepID=A0AAD4ZEC5_PRUDU|nr:hypothetical protein L3X38_010346 [Prunus dulcis]